MLSLISETAEQPAWKLRQSPFSFSERIRAFFILNEIQFRAGVTLHFLHGSGLFSLTMEVYLKFSVTLHFLHGLGLFLVRQAHYDKEFKAVEIRRTYSSFPNKAIISKSCGPPETPLTNTRTNCMSNFPNSAWASSNVF